MQTRIINHISLPVASAMKLPSNWVRLQIFLGAGYYIHLKDHNKKITPEQTKLSLSFMNPKLKAEGCPEPVKHEFKLGKQAQKKMETKLFEEFRQNVLKGAVHQEKEEQTDPLWGQQGPPKHYYQNLSKLQLNTVSSPQNQDVNQHLTHYFRSFLQTKATSMLPLQQLAQQSPSTLVDLAVMLRRQECRDRQYWYQLEKSISVKLYTLTPFELVKLKYAICGKNTYTSSKFNQIVDDLLEDDLNQLSLPQLICLFFSCRYSKPNKYFIMRSCLSAIGDHLDQLSLFEKIDWLTTYTLVRRPLHLAKVQFKEKNEARYHAHRMLFKLNLEELSLTEDSFQKMVFCLAKLRASQTFHLSSQLLQFLLQKVDSLQPKSIYMAIKYLPQLENGMGVYDQRLFQKLKEKAIEHWNEYSDIQQIRIIHSYWNYGLMSQDWLQLYRKIQIRSDSSLLYYFCQLELTHSTEREWQVIYCMSELEYVPAPYYQSFSRFYRYIKASTDWNMKVISEKLSNTENYHDCQRYKQAFENIQVFSDMLNFFRFSNLPLPFQVNVPINNLEIVQMAYPEYKISIDFVDQKHCIPGTDALRQTYMNKVRSLDIMGWKHISYPVAETKGLTFFEVLKVLTNICDDHIQAQLERMKQAENQRAKQLQNQEAKMIEGNLVEQEWELIANNSADLKSIQKGGIPLQQNATLKSG